VKERPIKLRSCIEEDVREEKIAESIHTLCEREIDQVKLENKL
jgi:hypothetical protein